MPTLHELQMDFAAQVFDGEDRGIEALLRGHGLPGARRLLVYRNNISSTLIDALCAVYPVVERLVGEEFFKHMTAQYLRTYPSCSGDLREYGEQMSEYVEAFSGLKEMRYLRDVARLEWSYHAIFHAAHHAPLDLVCLGAVPPERYGELKFQINPASRLLGSPYPILRIWQVNQTDFSGDMQVDLQASGDKLLLVRPALDIEIEVLSDGAYALLTALRDGRNFATATGLALAAQPGFDIGSALQYFVFRHVLVGVNLG